MTVYEECSKCGDYVEDTDYISGIGLVCKWCSRKIREEKKNEETKIKNETKKSKSAEA